MIHSNTWNNLTVCKRISFSSFKNICQNVLTNHIYIYIYIYREYLALNNLEWLICHKTKPNSIITFENSVCRTISMKWSPLLINSILIEGIQCPDFTIAHRIHLSVAICKQFKKWSLKLYWILTKILSWIRYYKYLLVNQNLTT